MYEETSQVQIFLLLGLNRLEEKMASSLEAQLRIQAAKSFGEHYPTPFLARSILDLMDLLPQEVYWLSKPKGGQMFEDSIEEIDIFMQDPEPGKGGNLSPIAHKLQACKCIAEILVDGEVIPTLFEAVGSYLSSHGWKDPGVLDKSRVGKAIGFCSAEIGSITDKDRRRLVSALNTMKRYMALGSRSAKMKEMCLCRGAGVLALVALSLNYNLCGDPPLATQLEFDMRGVCNIHDLKEKVSAIIDTGEVKSSLDVKSAVMQLACKLKALGFIVEKLYTDKGKTTSCTLIGRLFMDKKQAKKSTPHSDMLTLATNIGFSLFLHGG